VRGRTITDETYQINFTVTTESATGPKPPEEVKAEPPPAPPKVAEKRTEKLRPKKTGKKPSKKK
jgi:hypothetical protein